jgi:hypothetical protein
MYANGCGGLTEAHDPALTLGVLPYRACPFYFSSSHVV